MSAPRYILRSPATAYYTGKRPLFPLPAVRVLCKPLLLLFLIPTIHSPPSPPHPLTHRFLAPQPCSSTPALMDAQWSLTPPPLIPFSSSSITPSTIFDPHPS
ncbi:unnamed protein product [Pleuronectes platessa]|uniref:Uncharacterized protein n=1 Tax=Pleuronectes platessa TaxID=8262 RepID=A0A9N7YTB8_PLEPL|nr:unnamed protein product [Pleuronectes platessa]